jgi:hypothetical protein
LDEVGEGWHDSTYACREPHEELQRVCVEMRTLDGMERFMLPLLEHEMKGLARNGYIVCFNVGQLRSEAFVVTKAAVKVVLLPALTVDFVNAALDVIAIKGYRGNRLPEPTTDSDTEEETSPGEPQTELLRFNTVGEMLRHLWIVAVYPVLESLGLHSQKSSSSDLPHICWAASGDMMLLPLHAAGNHDVGVVENTLSYVVSSYATSLKILQRGQQEVVPDPVEASKSEILVVSMPTTPGQYKDLKATEEADAVVSSTRSWANCTVLTQRGKDDVMGSIHTSPIIHFACHGTTHPFRPDKSCFIVGKDVQESFSIGDLAKVTRPRSQLAYLSACSTAETRAPKMSYGSIHLASTFQLIGFRNVVASLWAVDDDTAVVLADMFYNIVTPEDLNKTHAFARRLHEALVTLRERKRNKFTVLVDLTNWASFACYSN